METVVENQEAVGQVVDLLAASRSILFITGAGISADSGLPTFRDSDGLYATGMTSDGIPFERALSSDVMCDHPELTWECLAQIGRACCGARHNRAHEVIAEMERHFERVLTVTQNVDGLHRAAGARNLIDLHGDVHNLRCMRCRHRQTVADYRCLEVPPRCPKCPGLLRPDVVLFGEPLAEEKLMTMLIEMDRGFDLIFSIGTSSVFSYIAEPVQMAALFGTPTVEINPGVSEVSDLVDVKLTMRAVPALDAIWRCY
ncbi:MAG: NAD-dependent protein deacylase, partial [Planctomycetes bacterium RBG_13_62_9]